jgi:succinate dehydrogenase/fumarate reductase flavoprotein subunit
MELERRSCDVLVVGGGGAGLATAAEAAGAGAEVLLVSKDPLSVGDTRISTGVVALPGSGSADDGPERLVEDMRASGGGLADEGLLRAYAGDLEGAYRWLEGGGLRARRGPDGPAALPAPMGGHSRPRSVPHPGRGGDVVEALAARAAGVDALDDAWCCEILKAGERAAGALIWLAREGRPLVVQSRAVVLATGGLGTLYFPHTDTLRGNTGDGFALAARAGAALVQMEQVQFTPFGMAGPAGFAGLPLGEAVLAGPRGRLLDGEGALIARDIHRLNRAQLAGLIGRALAEGRGTARGGVWLDLSGNLGDAAWEAWFRAHFGAVLRRVRRAWGVEAARFEAPWEVCPTAHYFMGGVRVDERGESAVPGLFAAGQVMGGLHGANRLGSTSIPELVVFGRRAARAAAALGPAGAPEVAAALGRLLEGGGGEPAIGLTRALQRAAWAGLGPARTAEGIRAALGVCAEVRGRLGGMGARVGVAWDTELLGRLELESLLDCAEAIGAAALERAGSLGAHVRLDEQVGVRW